MFESLRHDSVLRCLLLTGLISARPLGGLGPDNRPASLRRATRDWREIPPAALCDLYLTIVERVSRRDCVSNHLTANLCREPGRCTIAALSFFALDRRGNLTTGETTTVRLYFSIPDTVVRFSIMKTATVKMPLARPFNFSNAQSVVVPVSVPHHRVRQFRTQRGRLVQNRREGDLYMLGCKRQRDMSRSCAGTGRGNESGVRHGVKPRADCDDYSHDKARQTPPSC